MEPKEKKTESFTSILIAILLALAFRSTIASPYKIPSGSMIPTLKIGDFIFVNKLSYGVKIPFTNKNLINFSPPKRGDVIVFIKPIEKIDLIKRVVGVAGDKIELKNDLLFINDQPAMREKILETSKYLEDASNILNEYPSPPASVFFETIDTKKHTMMEFNKIADNFGPWTVPPGHLFMMGDNRDNSGDSRFWGFLPIENVRGRAMFFWLSLDSSHPYITFINHPFDFIWHFENLSIPSIRFNRLGHKVI